MNRGARATPPATAAGLLSRWAPLVAYLALIFWMSSRPHPDFLVAPEWPFNPYHLVEYLLLGILFFRAAAGGIHAPAESGVFAITFAFCVSWAVTDEVHQAFVPGRFPDPLDLRDDVIGVSAAILVVLALRYARRAGRKRDAP